MGARPTVDITRRKLRACGAHRVTRGAVGRTRNNPHGLTKRESQVLLRAASGGRHAGIVRQLFVADRTVDLHVCAVLSKLNVGSRREAAALAKRFGLRVAAT